MRVRGVRLERGGLKVESGEKWVEEVFPCTCGRQTRLAKAELGGEEKRTEEGEGEDTGVDARLESSRNRWVIANDPQRRAGDCTESSCTERT
jgi:hypothetical protein